MTKLLLKLPWFLSAPAVVAVVLILAVGTNLALGDYFERTFLDEANPLLGSPGGSGPDRPAGLAMQLTATLNAAAPTTGVGASPTAAASPPASAQTQAPAGPAILARGQFRDGAPGHNGSGSATLGRDANGKLFLVFENFSVTNGPDLRVILGASDAGGGSGLDLGALKATDGNFSYPIPDGTDVSGFRSVTIWCKSFPTIFAVATLGVGS